MKSRFYVKVPLKNWLFYNGYAIINLRKQGNKVLEKIGEDTMEKTVIKAQDRSEKVKQVRSQGFVPGILYGAGLKGSKPVQFDAITFNKIIATHTDNAKLWVEFGGKKHFGMIKEVQRNVLNGQVIHVDVHMLSQKDTIRIKLPIEYAGMHGLLQKDMDLKIQSEMVDISGPAVLLPERVTVNVEGLELGDTITIKDFNLDKKIVVHDPEDQVYATVAERKEQVEMLPEEEPEEAEEAGEETGEAAAAAETGEAEAETEAQ